MRSQTFKPKSSPQNLLSAKKGRILLVPAKCQGIHMKMQNTCYEYVISRKTKKLPDNPRVVARRTWPPCYPWPVLIRGVCGHDVDENLRPAEQLAWMQLVNETRKSGTEIGEPQSWMGVSPTSFRHLLTKKYYHACEAKRHKRHHWQIPRTFCYQQRRR